MKTSTIGVGAALIGAFALGALVIAYSSAQDKDDAPAAAENAAPISTSFSQLEEDDIRKIVHDYLMTHPEVIIDAVNVYSARERDRAAQEAQTSAAANLKDLLDPKTSFVAGKNPDAAKVAVVEMFDYHCGYCKHAVPIVKKMIDTDPAVKVVFRELPILREESGFAAQMSLAARDQGKYLDLHYAMMDASGVLTKTRIEDIAKKQGLDVAQMEEEVKQPAIPAAILENQRMASQMGVDGTPAFVVATTDGAYVKVVSGYRPDALADAVKEAKKAAK